MAYNYIVFLFLFLYNIDFVSPIVYSCDQNIECGCSKTNADVGKIVGGESAINSSWGWAVSLQKSVNGHFCGGVIISSLDVITAAHCIEDPFEMIRNVKVVVGIDTLSQSGSSIAQVRSIVSVMSHPQYDKKSNANDIAVLRLNQPLNISNEKGTARLCLPHVVPIDTANNYPIPDSSLVAIGWGVLASEQISIPSYRHLRQVTLNTISPNHRMCKSVINDQKLQFCAGVIGGGKDTCQGDSGGPIMHFELDKRRWVLAGITSYGIYCGLPAYAGVYTRASVYHSWLQSIVTNKFDELSINGISSYLTDSTSSYWTDSTSSYSTDSARSLVSPYWSLVLSLYVFANK